MPGCSKISDGVLLWGIITTVSSSITIKAIAIARSAVMFVVRSTVVAVADFSELLLECWH